MLTGFGLFGEERIYRWEGWGHVKPARPGCLMLLLVSVLMLPSIAEASSEYGDKIKETPEYERITTPRSGGGNNNSHHHHYHYYDRDYYYGPEYPRRSPYYASSPQTGRSSGGGLINLGIAIGKSEFDYDDIEDGDAFLFHLGYRPRDSRLAYEFSIFDSGKAEVTSLSGIDLEVDTLNFSLVFNSSSHPKSTLNFFGQGGIYFANTTLSGPFDRVSERSNGFLVALGFDVMINQHFSLRLRASNLLDVEDFADDESVSFYSFGGQFVF